MSATYDKINWEDSPSTETPLNAENLGLMDTGIKDAIDLANQNESNIASNYSTSVMYVAGDVVRYNGLIYRCTSTTYTLGEFDASSWEEESIADQLEGVYKSIGDLNDASNANAGEISDLKDASQALEQNKANIDGSYDTMTVGNAKQLVSTVGIEDQVPYLFRTSGGSVDIGDREYDKIVGGSVVWNQMLRSSAAVATTTKHGVTFTAVSGKFAFTTSGTFSYTSGDKNVYIFNNNGESLIKDHKYLITNTSKYYDVYVYAAFTTDETSVTGNSLNRSNQGGVVINCTNSGRFRISLFGGDNIQNDTVMNEIIYVNVFDLTQMFGTTIADYIYTLETATAGAGVAWFKKLFPKDYYAYNPGELMSVSGVSAHEMVGFNAWDEEWELGGYDASTGKKTTGSTAIRSKNKIPVVPGARYYFRIGGNSSTKPYLYDASGNYIERFGSYIKNDSFTIPDNVYFITFALQHTYGTTYNHDICINLHWDGERDGEYEPYIKHSYPLDSDLTLRGIPKLDSGNNLYYDGDTYESDGTVTRRYGIVTYDGSSDENWSYYTIASEDNANNLFRIVQADRKNGSITGGECQAIANGYAKATNATTGRTNMTLSGSTSTNFDFVNAACSTVEAWKTYLASNPVTVVYELATPTTESADPFQSPQIVDDWGTEEYVTTGIVPVGHETVYSPNLRAKLEMSPNSPNGDGDYLVRQTNGENEYVEYVNPVPSAPTTNGTYVLKATVSGGTATLTWVAEGGE